MTELTEQFDIPAGHLAEVVTLLEMRAAPTPAVAPASSGLEIRRVEKPSGDWYLRLFRAVGEEWLWESRLRLSADELRAILEDERVEIYALMREGREIGLLELDFRKAGACELKFFGVVREAIGSGAASFLMREAIARAWAKPIEQFWLRTCTLDHQRAVAFYMKAGFTPVKRWIAVFPDPRLGGLLRREAGAHAPVIES
ncbi:GNAT family N-acetyltransferase [Terrarubrum flagellatum]|uniref:GNAT family N-acetyltransferase n=1 Tax=Terrirubrum flagellatum TaxID=2895980 RepID=UPI003144E0B4